MNLFTVRGDEVVKIYGAKAGVVDVGRHARGAVRGTNCARDKARLLWREKSVSGAAGDFGSFHVKLVDDLIEPILRQSNGRGVKSVSL